MRIAILTNAFPPDNKGGAGRIAALQAEGLRKAGHEVRVWAMGSEPRVMGDTRRNDAAVTRFFGRDLAKMHPFARLWFHLVTDAAARKEVVGEIVAWKPQRIITHNLTGCGIGTPRAIQAAGVPWTHLLHDIQLTDPSGQETAKWSRTWIAQTWRAFWSARRRQVFGEPDALLSPTQWLLDWHRQHGFHGKQERVVPNPIEMTLSRIRALKTPATVVYVGRLSRDKGFDRFLNVIAALPPSLVNQITVVGKGSMIARAKRITDARVDLVGELPPDAVRQIIADADLLIAPSRLLENQQTILLEAMSVGTPVIATDVGGTRETLEGTGCSVVAPDHLAEEATRLLSDTSAWQDISRKMEGVIRKRVGNELGLWF
ncbi:MAG: hypothetical protein RL141_940 [Candidatus Parcubacteria bacterium]|jgi:glycosyltransferase involved in cell wall biosynthesis